MRPMDFFETPADELKLKDHQSLALSALRHALSRECHGGLGKKRPLLQSPTGSGKTIIAVEIIKCALAKGKRVVFTVPAIGLIEGTIEKLRRYGVRDIGIIQADTPQDPDAAVQVVSVQSIWSRPEHKLPKADLVLVDEAHLRFKFYKKWMAMPSWQDVPFIGLSATPWSGGLGEDFDHLIVVATTRELIDKGELVDFEAYAPKQGRPKPNLDGIKTLGGDYQENQLSDEMRKTPLVADAVQTWLEKGENRPTLVFCVDRAHANAIHEQFLKAGVVSEYIDAKIDRIEREAIGKRLEKRETQVVCNIGCLTFGVDWPFVSCIVLCRPTKSEILFTQIMGRGLRTAPAKTNCIILDHSDTTRRLGTVDEIHYEHLDDGKTKGKGKTEKKERTEPLPTECLCCGRIKPARVTKCPSCGFEPKARSTIEHADGELALISGKVTKADKSTKQSWYSQFLFIAAERRNVVNKDGWAANKYREKFGVWPKDLRTYASR